MPDNSRETRINDFARVAIRIEREASIPAPFLLAQWAVESAWGEKCTGAFNYWGITYNPNLHPTFKWCATREVLSQRQVDRLDPEEKRDLRVTNVLASGKMEVRLKRRFAAFPSAEEGLRSYVRLLLGKTTYRTAVDKYTTQPKTTEALNTFIEEIARAGYATDPEYANVLKGIASQANVTRALAQARAELK